MDYTIYEKKLVDTPKKSQQKYLILLSDQTVIIDTEYEAMKNARNVINASKYPKYIVDMLPTNVRVNKRHTTLSTLLENVENYKSNGKENIESAGDKTED